MAGDIVSSILKADTVVLSLYVDTILQWSSSSRMCVMTHNWSECNETASSSTECNRDKPLFSFVSGQDSTIWDIVWVSPQGHRSVSVSRHFLLQAPQCPCSVQKRFSRDHCCRGRSKPGCRIVGSHTRWELTWADFQLCLHRLLMSAGCKSCHSGFLDVSRSNGGLRISGWIGQNVFKMSIVSRSTSRNGDATDCCYNNQMVQFSPLSPPHFLIKFHKCWI